MKLVEVIKGKNIMSLLRIAANEKQIIDRDAQIALMKAAVERNKNRKKGLKRMLQICKSIAFHFNKKHLEDPSIPMWVIKAKGETYYVEHVDCKVGWSTKETPDNSSTKGSIKIKNCSLNIENGVALITPPP